MNDVVYIGIDFVIAIAYFFFGWVMARNKYKPKQKG